MMMKVVIVGNSNCVFAKGFSFGVKESVTQDGGYVRNYSLGGSCCALHIYTFHDKFAELCEANVVIIDSLIIDTFHYKRNIIRHEELMSLIDDMYALYSQLPGKVVSVLFPIEMHATEYEHLATYRAHKESARKYGVDVLDMYKMLPSNLEDYSGFFMQPSHIRLEISSDIGYRLASICKGLIRENAEEIEVATPYQVVKGGEFGSLESFSVESSHYTETCYKLDKGICLERYAGKSLIGALHWNKGSVSKFVCTSEAGRDVVLFRSQYAFFEVLNTRRKIDAGAAIRPGCFEEKITQHAAGNSIGGDFGIPHFAGLLLREDGCVNVRNLGVSSELNDQMGMAFG